MADLVLQDFRELSIQNLVQVLSIEKPKMFGELKFHAKKGGSHSLTLRLVDRFICEHQKSSDLTAVLSLTPGGERKEGKKC
jgi:hypothetical protein